MPPNISKIAKGIKINPKEISLTGRPKTGLSLLFWKSEEPGGSSKMITSDEAKTSLQKAYDELSKFKEQIPDSVLAEMEKSLKESVSTRQVEELIKSDATSPEVKAILKTLTDKATASEKQLEIISKQFSDREKKDEEQRVEILKKSCEEFTKNLDTLPMKEDLSEVLFEIKKAVTPEIAAKVEDFLSKSHEALKAAIEKAGDPTGKNSQDDTRVTGNGKIFAENLKKAVDADTSNDSRINKIVRITKSMATEDPTGYEAYEKLSNTGEISAVI